jgi:hypothetical protein
LPRSPSPRSAGSGSAKCADTHCTLRINATLQEYETVRANGRTFLVCPGHVYPEVERVVAENDRFATVEKLSDAGQIAESLDPRHIEDASQRAERLLPPDSLTAGHGPTTATEIDGVDSSGHGLS